jgi:hypothetical protein
MLLEAFLEPFFDPSISVLVAFAVISSALEDRCPFRAHFSRGHRKSPRNVADAPKPSRGAWQSRILYDHQRPICRCVVVQKKPAASRPSWHCLCLNLLSIIAALPYASWSIRNVSKGNLCSKTQNFVFTRRSIADIFECNEPKNI